MKCTIPEISWHNRDPVLSVDIQPTTNESFYRLASGGTDSHVLIWHLTILDTGASSIDPVSDLTRHQKAVNVVRWSHSGQYLASGDDDANIIIWHQKSDDLAIMLDGDNEDKEKWSVFKVLRGHKEDVYDISWSPDSLKLISGSVDNTAIIWDLTKGLNDNILTDHKGFVQGVAWDPLGQYVATLSSDRVCRVFNDTGKQVKARLKKGVLPLPESHCLYGQIVRYFHDDTLKSFFRRLSFSPDGSFIVTPAGCLEMGSNNKNLYTSYLFSTSNLSQPAIILPSPGQYTVAARCCPILFQLRPDGPDPVVSLPYRIVFAIATRSSVILYDTQQMSPFATISNIHYTRLTDVTWSQDGRLLAVSSTDGFCSLVTFEPGELGVEYVKEVEIVEEKSQEEEIMDVSLVEKVEEKKEIKPSFLQMWTKRAQEEKDEQKIEKPISRIEVRRKPKEDIEKPISRIEVRRKPKEETKTDDIKIEKPVSKIEVRRQPRENLDVNVNKEMEKEKPISKIEVRRTPRKSLENEFKNLEKQHNKTEEEQKISVLENTEQENNQTSKNIEEGVSEINKTSTENKTISVLENDSKKTEPENDQTSKNIEEVVSEINKPSTENKAESENLMDVDEDVIFIDEKENQTNNTESKQKTAAQNNKVNKKTPSKQKTNRIATPFSKKKRAPKLNSLKKTPTGQLNITQFLKSPLVKPSSKPKEKINPYILLEDYSKTGKTYTHTKDDLVENSDDSDSNCAAMFVSTVLNFEEEDSQNIKLVLEDDTLNEKMEVEENLENTTNTEIKNEKELTINDENVENTTNIENKNKESTIINDKNLENTTNIEIKNMESTIIDDENLENTKTNSEIKNENHLTINHENLKIKNKESTINDESLENITKNSEIKNDVTINDENLENTTNIENKNDKLTINDENLENTTNTEIKNKESTMNDENLENTTTNSEIKNENVSMINDENQENTTNNENKNKKLMINDENLEKINIENKNDKKLTTNDENTTNTEIKNENDLKINDENLTNGDIKTTECDIKCLEKLENINLLPKDSPAKKRVPLITLSSPKHKKKTM